MREKSIATCVKDRKVSEKIKKFFYLENTYDWKI